MAAHHKCYRLFSSPSKITGLRARDTCRTLGFELATVKTELKANSVFTLLWGLRTRALFGLTCSARSQPFMYRWFLMWSDNTAIYNANHLPLWCFDYWDDEYCVFQVYDSRLYTDIYAQEYHFVCEKRVQQYDVFMSPSIDLFPGPKPPFLISSHLGFVHPLQDVALHQCLPSSSVCCLPNPGGSLLLCYVILPSSAWSSSRPLPSPWLPLCASPCPPIVL